MDTTQAATTASGALSAPLHAYRPGLHIIVDGKGVPPGPLNDLPGFRSLMEEAVAGLGLNTVGSVHHAFDGGGFTSVVCLTESHVSIHTWPEHGRVTFDVFLSNFSRVNDAAAESIVERIRSFLGGSEYTRIVLRR